MRIILLSTVLAATASPAVSSLLATYQAAGAKPDAEAGRAAWTRAVPGEDGQPRSCSTCHTANPKAGGKHKTTGEAIDPLAPSANPSALTDTANIEKWFGRNCRWTWGRECTAQEKADFLLFLNQ